MSTLREMRFIDSFPRNYLKIFHPGRIGHQSLTVWLEEQKEKKNTGVRENNLS